MAKNNTGVAVEHTANGLTHIYALGPDNLYTCQVALIQTLKSVLVPNQYARILKLCYGLNSTFWTEVTDFSATETMHTQNNNYANFIENLNHDWTAKIDVDIEEVTDALAQIPVSDQHKILEFSGIKEWRSDTIEEWTGTSLFSISSENLAELKKYFSDLYDWGTGNGCTNIVFHEDKELGFTCYAITGVFTDHATLNESYIEENGLDFEDYAENIELLEIIQEFANPNQEISITTAGMDNKKCYLFVENHKI